MSHESRVQFNAERTASGALVRLWRISLEAQIGFRTLPQEEDPKKVSDAFNYPRKNPKKAGRILFIRPASLLCFFLKLFSVVKTPGYLLSVIIVSGTGMSMGCLEGISI